MTGSSKQRRGRSRPRRHPAATAAVLAGAILAYAAALAAVALAAGATVGSASNAQLGERIVVNAQGRTLYTLSGETPSHLKCKSSACLKFWPPLTVPSRNTKLKAGPGVQGRLALVRRSNGLLQVTLRGVPLYRYSGDHAKGQANGQGIESFGGTWSAATATSGGGAKMPKAPAPGPAPGPYGY